MRDVYIFVDAYMYTQVKKEHWYRQYYKIFCIISIGTCIVWSSIRTISKFSMNEFKLASTWKTKAISRYINILQSTNQNTNVLVKKANF